MVPLKKYLTLEGLRRFKGKLDNLFVKKTDVATADVVGLVKPDRDTLVVAEDGTMSSASASMRSVDVGIDWDTLTAPGLYFISGEPTGTNHPPASDGGVIHVERTSVGDVYQEMIQGNPLADFRRRLSGGSWNDWTLMGPTTAMSDVTTLDTGYNLDELTVPGVYFLQDIAQSQGKPPVKFDSENNSGGLFYVTSIDGGATYQEFIHANPPSVWRRRWSFGWNDWVLIGPIDSTHLTTESLDDIKAEFGVYYASNGNTCQNLPELSGNTAFGMLVFRCGAKYIKQILFPRSEAWYCERHYSVTESSWTAWKYPFGNVASVSSQMAIGEGTTDDVLTFIRENAEEIRTALGV